MHITFFPFLQIQIYLAKQETPRTTSKTLFYQMTLAYFFNSTQKYNLLDLSAFELFFSNEKRFLGNAHDLIKLKKLMNVNLFLDMNLFLIHHTFYKHNLSCLLHFKKNSYVFIHTQYITNPVVTIHYSEISEQYIVSSIINYLRPYVKISNQTGMINLKFTLIASFLC